MISKVVEFQDPVNMTVIINVCHKDVEKMPNILYLGLHHHKKSHIKYLHTNAVASTTKF